MHSFAHRSLRLPTHGTGYISTAGDQGTVIGAANYQRSASFGNRRHHRSKMEQNLFFLETGVPGENYQLPKVGVAPKKTCTLMY